jgi:hypothetical protein
MAVSIVVLADSFETGTRVVTTVAQWLAKELPMNFGSPRGLREE